MTKLTLPMTTTMRAMLQDELLLKAVASSIAKAGSPALQQACGPGGVRDLEELKRSIQQTFLLELCSMLEISIDADNDTVSIARKQEPSQERTVDTIHVH